MFYFYFIVLPYLHHNPYSKKSNAIGPYSHCDAAMSKVAVAIAPALQRTAEEEFILANENSTKNNKTPRKQTMPRKLLNPKMEKEQKPRRNKRKSRRKAKISNVQQTKARKILRQDCEDTRQDGNPAISVKQRRIVTRSGQSYSRIANSRNTKKLAKKDSICDTITSHIRNFKLLKVSPNRGRCCLMGHGTPIAFRSGANYIRHLFWCHHAMRFRCHLCSSRFRHEYQVLLHRRSVHEN